MTDSILFFLVSLLAAEDPEASLTYAGRVLDPEGRPVAGAAVFADNGQSYQSAAGFDRPAWSSYVPDPLATADVGPFTVRGRRPTDAEGRFEVTGVARPAGGWVTVVHPPFLTAQVPADPARLVGLRLDVGEIRLVRGVPLEAAVMDAAGRAIEGAWVVARPETSRRRPKGWPASDGHGPGAVRVGRTDAAGRCRIEGLGAEGTYLTAAFSDRHPASEATVETGAAGGRASFRLALGRSLRVEVADRYGGAPRANVRVELERREEGGGPYRTVLARATTDQNGVAVFEGLGDEPLHVTASPTDLDFGSVVTTPTPFSVTAAVRPGETARLLLDPALRLRVAVRDAATGAPIAGVRVTAWPEWPQYDKTGGFPHDLKATSEEAAPTLEIAGIRPGPWRLSVFAPDHLPVRTVVVQVPPAGLVDPFEVRLEPAQGEAAGRVVAGGQPVAGATVSAYEWIDWLGGGQRVSGTTGADGRFLLRPLLGAGWPLLLTVQAPGFLRVERRWEEKTGRPADLGDVPLVRAASVRGRLVDAAGRAVRHVPLDLMVHGGRRSYKADYAGRAVTGEDGAFVFDDVRPGRYRLDDGKGTTAEVEVAEGATAEVQLTKR